MNITFLGQGFESSSVNAVGNYLIKCLNQNSFHSFIGISAFASEAGVFGLSGHLHSAKQNFKSITLIVGIDQDGTSKEALEQILILDINSYIFYQKESPIFHPKIYLFEGEKEFKLIVGSSNLTRRGLFTNVESSLLIEFDINDLEGISLLNELKTYYKSLFDLSDKNLFKISNALIADFMAKGIVLDEVTRRKIYGKKSIGISTVITPVNDTIKIPKRLTSKIPSLFPTKTKSTGNSGLSSVLLTTVSQAVIVPAIQEETLVWDSGPLTERDLTIPKGATTHRTGSMLFKKGEIEEIDQRHYFRDVVFSSLPWAYDNNPKKAHLEKATAFFHIIIEAVDHGVFPLILTHNTRTDTKSYKQKNSMTWVSWGKARRLIAIDNLIGKSARLYKSEKVFNQYTLVIK